MAAQQPRTAAYVVIQATEEGNIDIGKEKNVWATTKPHTRILTAFFNRDDTDVYLFFTTYADPRNTQVFSGLARMKELPCRPPIYWNNGEFGEAFSVDWIVKNGTTPIVLKPAGRGNPFYNDAEEMPAWVARTPLHAFLNNATLIDPNAPLINPAVPANVLADVQDYLAAITPPSAQVAPVINEPVTRERVIRTVGPQAARTINSHFKTVSAAEAMRVMEADLKIIKKKDPVKEDDPKRIASHKARKKARERKRKKREARALRRKKREARIRRRKKKEARAHGKEE